MKREILILLFFATSASCSKSKVIDNKVKSPFNLKYEINTTSSVISSSPLNPVITKPVISYVNETGQAEVSQTFTSGNSWSKTVTVTDIRRPFFIQLMCFNIDCASAGKVSAAVFLNNKQVASAENSTFPLPLFGHRGLVQLTYYVE